MKYKILLNILPLIQFVFERNQVIGGESGEVVSTVIIYTEICIEVKKRFFTISLRRIIWVNRVPV